MTLHETSAKICNREPGEGEKSVQLTSLLQLVRTADCNTVIRYFFVFTKLAILIRKSTALSLPVQ
jgi:hypothetical protein